MSLLTLRSQTSEDIAKGRFISKVLEKNSREIDAEMQKRMNAARFKSAFWRNRNFATNNNVLTYTHLPQHRFVDMKTRQTKDGVIRKKNHRVHNRVLFGHANNIVRELSFGFVQSVKEELMQLDGTRL